MKSQNSCWVIFFMLNNERIVYAVFANKRAGQKQLKRLKKHYDPTCFMLKFALRS